MINADAAAIALAENERFGSTLKRIAVLCEDNDLTAKQLRTEIIALTKSALMWRHGVRVSDKKQNYVVSAAMRRGPTVFVSLANRIFSGWTVLDRAPDKSNRTMWNCRCVCGTLRPVSAGHLVRGKSKSCGCLRPRGHNNARYVHGGSSTSMHNRWSGMIRRCENKNDAGYSYYGARGIKVCERWRDSFADFLADMGNPPSSKHSLERIDVNGHYEPANCRWATAKEQSRNTRRNHHVTVDGRIMTLIEAVEMFGLDYRKVNARLLRGESFEKAMHA